MSSPYQGSDAAGSLSNPEGAPEPESGHGVVAQSTLASQRPLGDTWPDRDPAASQDAVAPPVGLNWTVVAEKTGIDVRVLEHDAAIVLAGAYVPAPGFVIDPVTFLARSARIGARVLRHSYFVGELTASEFHVALPLDPDIGSVPNAVVRTASAPVIGLFASPLDAERARRHIIEGSTGYGVTSVESALGTELHVARTDDPSRVATVIAGNHGAVISVGGEAL